MFRWIRQLFFSPERFCRKHGHAWEVINPGMERCQTCGVQKYFGNHSSKS